MQKKENNHRLNDLNQNEMKKKLSSMHDKGTNHNTPNEI